MLHKSICTDSSLELFVYCILFRCIRNTVFSTVQYIIKFKPDCYNHMLGIYYETKAQIGMVLFVRIEQY